MANTTFGLPEGNRNRVLGTDPQALSVLGRLRSMANLSPTGDDYTDKMTAQNAEGLDDYVPEGDSPELKMEQEALAQKTGMGFSRDALQGDIVTRLRNKLASDRAAAGLKIAEVTAPEKIKAQSALDVAGVNNAALAAQRASEADKNSAEAGATRHGQDITDKLLDGSGSGPSGSAGASLGGVAMSPRVDAKGGVAWSPSPANKQPAQILTRQDNAARVMDHINLIEQQANALNQKGLISPMMGRFAHFVGGTMQMPSMVTKSPEDAKLLTDFYQNLSTLSSGMAMVHGGARGGGSPEMTKRFDTGLQNGYTDVDGLKGTLNSMREWLKGYAQGQAPDEQPPLEGDLPGSLSAEAQGATDPTDPFGLRGKR